MKSRFKWSKQYVYQSHIIIMIAFFWVQTKWKSIAGSMLSIQVSEHFDNAGRFGGVWAIFLGLLSFTSLPSSLLTLDQGSVALMNRIWLEDIRRTFILSERYRQNGLGKSWVRHQVWSLIQYCCPTQSLEFVWEEVDRKTEHEFDFSLRYSRTSIKEWQETQVQSSTKLLSVDC